MVTFGAHHVAAAVVLAVALLCWPGRTGRRRLGRLSGRPVPARWWWRAARREPALTACRGGLPDGRGAGRRSAAGWPEPSPPS